VVGAGAVGCYFGGVLARAGAPVTLIGRATHVEAINRDGLFIDGVKFKEHIPVSASTELEAVRHADLVLFCVKTVDTESTAKALAPLLASGAIVVSLQNGADNAERIRAASGIPAVAAAVYVAAAMSGPGQVKHTGRGDLVVGIPEGGRAGKSELEEIAATFTRAGVPCRISENVTTELWEKLIINCAYNAASALSRANYGRILQDPEAAEVMKLVVNEAVAVAEASGVRLGDMTEAVFRLGKVMSETISSTAQDIARGKVTEIDSLNGFIVRKGAELGVATPVNLTLHALVKLLERAPH
jgi:2-dehydropantoate 2-reductase